MPLAIRRRESGCVWRFVLRFWLFGWVFGGVFFVFCFFLGAGGGGFASGWVF